MTNISEMSRSELIGLKDGIERRLAEFRPLRLKKHWKRCGKERCFCSEGPLDGSWGNLHGPYVFAQFVDHQTRKTRVVSLGRFYDAGQLDERLRARPEWSKYYTVAPDKKKIEDCYFFDLTGAQFKEFYGLEKEEDKLARPTRYYGREAARDSFLAAERQRSERAEAAKKGWARGHGIGSVTGQKKLMQLLRDDYYLVTDFDG